MNLSQSNQNGAQHPQLDTCQKWQNNNEQQTTSHQLPLQILMEDFVHTHHTLTSTRSFVSNLKYVFILNQLKVYLNTNKLGRTIIRVIALLQLNVRFHLPCTDQIRG